MNRIGRDWRLSLTAAATKNRQSRGGGSSPSEATSGANTDSYPKARWLEGASSEVIGKEVVILLMPACAPGGGYSKGGGCGGRGENGSCRKLWRK